MNCQWRLIPSWDKSGGWYLMDDVKLHDEIWKFVCFDINERSTELLLSRRYTTKTTTAILKKTETVSSDFVSSGLRRCFFWFFWRYHFLSIFWGKLVWLKLCKLLCILTLCSAICCLGEMFWWFTLCIFVCFVICVLFCLLLNTPGMHIMMMILVSLWFVTHSFRCIFYNLNQHRFVCHFLVISYRANRAGTLIQTSLHFIHGPMSNHSNNQRMNCLVLWS